jgi:hypothetical protein
LTCAAVYRASRATGVGQDVSFAATGRGMPSARVPDTTSSRDLASCSSGVLSVLYTVGVGQYAIFAWSSPKRPNLSAVVGVTHEASLAWSLSQPVSPCSALCDG